MMSAIAIFFRQLTSSFTVSGLPTILARTVLGMSPTPPSGSKGSFPQERQVNTGCTVLIFRGHLVSSVEKRRKEITVGKWLRSIERGFVQAENNHLTH
jgi:hypothetical protein